jgi:hypothetical protein
MKTVSNVLYMSRRLLGWLHSIERLLQEPVILVKNPWYAFRRAVFRAARIRKNSLAINQRSQNLTDSGSGPTPAKRVQTNE